MTKSKDKKVEQHALLDFRQAAREFRNTFASTTTLFMSSLTLVAGLAWNDFAKALFSRLERQFSGWGETIGLFLYALVVSIIVVLVVQRLKKIQEAVGGESIKKEPKKLKSIK